ncbi:hypothetical protein GCM10007939_19100 [Amylibacter marinus]|uniref:DUF1761 domain-containing protein n=1 Tax=Amylibacter marinus TaxID=1475483 RepID=A0ABQ5VWQ8_9RHOB|nr:DUF1761 domain-containing protein [Amylibacter marinus]GLQ35627.1 hypothetical protein GCM10007939_19100 [Amylibacter marinus]
MEFISVVVAAVASYAFGAVWYMALAKPWMAAAGVSEEQMNNGDKAPFIIAFVCAILVAGMMRHIFALAGIDTIGKGLIAGLGMGLFISTPWLATCYSFGNRPRKLIAIDGGYATIGSAIMGLVLTLF